jgi:hypothetical protein
MVRLSPGPSSISRSTSRALSAPLRPRSSLSDGGKPARTLSIPPPPRKPGPSVAKPSIGPSRDTQEGGRWIQILDLRPRRQLGKWRAEVSSSDLWPGRRCPCSRLQCSPRSFPGISASQPDRARPLFFEIRAQIWRQNHGEPWPRPFQAHRIDDSRNDR